METIVTALIGILVTFASSLTTYFFTRRKYNAEVEGNSIDNMDNSLDFYIKLANDNKEKLDSLSSENENLRNKMEEVLQENVKLMEQMIELRAQINKLTSIVKKNGITIK